MSVRDRSDHAREDVVVARLKQLAPVLDGEPDPAFRAATRARLVAMAAVRSPAPEPVTGLKRLLGFRAEDKVPVRWRARLTAGLAGAAMAVTAMATLVAVSTDAQPGDVLYGLKRGTEQTQLALAGDARGQTLLDFASTRLDEIERMVDDGPSALPPASWGAGSETVLAADADPALVIETLRTMDDQTRQGAEWLADRAVTTEDPGPLEDLGMWAAQQSADLTELQPRLPADARTAGAGSLELLGQITTRVTGLRDALECQFGPAVDGADAIGPVPVLCAAPEAPAPGGSGSGAGGTTGTGSVPGPSAPGSTTAPPATSGGVPVPSGVPGTGPTTGGSGGSGGGLEVPSAPVPSPSLPSLPPLNIPRELPGTGSSEPLIDIPIQDSLVDVCGGPVRLGDC
ncbi:DUF5667 domain-containing protein [Blastococcus sp. PRF04-17]|uniref:DUF5667 domain-containing protein n=1 Tax=Blastococcus sp. PRF04-17 TaxID=2933797 RepID=UPI001FF17878|nr:DUF5667 domain-containing protein [Blastococcus sp. PRF04-17]UOY00966.1 DUF5667 domain-containing protein [Blastococcus sp. PRF04-17]